LASAVLLLTLVVLHLTFHVLLWWTSTQYKERDKNTPLLPICTFCQQQNCYSLLHYQSLSLPNNSPFCCHLLLSRK
jgi:hypothetical protein